MKRWGSLICIILMGAFPLLAQQGSEATRRPPTAAQVMKFFEVMHIHDQMQSMLQTEQKQINIMMSDMFKKELPTASPKQRADFEKLISSAMNELTTNYPLDDVLRDMIPVYQAHLTESDLDQVIAFYTSAAGQRLLKEMPAMTAEAMRVSYGRMQPEIEKMMKNMDESIKQMAEEPDGTSDSKNSVEPSPAHH
jgi:hypothetical protein